MRKNNTNRLSAQVRLMGDYYEFEIENAEGLYSITYSTSPELIHREFLVQSTEDTIRVKNPVHNKRLIFFLRDEKGNEAVCATRGVDITSIENFRDIGGYKTKDDRSVKWGYFYRCGSLHDVSERDQTYLEHMGIKTLFDLRSKAEVKSNQDIRLSNWRYMNHSGITTMDDNTNKENLDMKSAIMNLIQQPEKIGELEAFLIDGYKTMSESTGAFEELFGVLKQGEVPIIFHCTAGKDRTGVSAALILLMLGVDEETVVNDYCLSNLYREEANNKQIEAMKEYIQDTAVLEGFKCMLGVKESYLRLTLESIKGKYGSYETFFKEALKVSEEEIEALREKYLY